MKVLTANEMSALVRFARDFSLSPDIVYKMIDAESSWNVAAKNKLSGARGLFQWTNTTARELGYTNADHLVSVNPDIESQLKVAAVYFRRYAPFKSDYEFAIANFLPTYRHAAPNTTLASLPNKNYAMQNPNIHTLNDYYTLVKSRKIPLGMKFPASTFTAAPLVLALAIFFCGALATVPVSGTISASAKIQNEKTIS